MNPERLILTFTAIIWEAMPFIVLGVVVAGLLEEFVPQQAFSRIIPRNRYLGIALGGILGLVFPMCECGIIVVMKRLLRKGLPLSVCISYMLAGPIINFVVMISTYVAFNYDVKAQIFNGAGVVVGLRVGLGFLVAFITALVVDWQYKIHGNALLHRSITHNLGGPDEPEEGTPPVKKTLRSRVDNITSTSLHDFVDIMAFLVLGAILAALSKEWLRTQDFAKDIRHVPAVAILVMMSFAVLMCLCSEADAFVAAAFDSAIWPPAAKIAFLVLGPMLDLKLYVMYTRVFRRRLIFTIICTVVIQVFVYTLVLHYCYDSVASEILALLGKQ